MFASEEWEKMPSYCTSKKNINIKNIQKPKTSENEEKNSIILKCTKELIIEFLKDETQIDNNVFSLSVQH